MPIARTMQWMGYALWPLAGVLGVIGAPDPTPVTWFVAFGVLGVAFHLSTRTQQRGQRLAAIVVMTAALFAMTIVRPCPYGALGLVLVASQVALVFSIRATAAWVIGQTVVVAFCIVPILGLVGLAEIIALGGFQAFAVTTIFAVRRLEALTRAHERTRIARDLHDVLGHDLTALALQLEIASHVGPEAARAHTARARELTDHLLRDVRAVVAAIHTDERPLVEAIRAIVVDAPGLVVHVDAPESLVIPEPRRADCIVRCVQEIVTNTRRHARGAENLWIRMRRDADAIVVEARDDGPGAAELHEGHGLRGMRSRLAELGGELEILAQPFVISARLPLGAAS
ncbi:MAG: histidine kinase [Deltaproteobacteria bacterium]